MLSPRYITPKKNSCVRVYVFLWVRYKVLSLWRCNFLGELFEWSTRVGKKFLWIRGVELCTVMVLWTKIREKCVYKYKWALLLIKSFIFIVHNVYSDTWWYSNLPKRRRYLHMIPNTTTTIIPTTYIIHCSKKWEKTCWQFFIYCSSYSLYCCSLWFERHSVTYKNA